MWGRGRSVRGQLSGDPSARAKLNLECRTARPAPFGLGRTLAERVEHFAAPGDVAPRVSAVLFSLFATLDLAGINPHHWLLDYLQACAANAGKAPAHLDPWLPWTVDKTRLERLRHPYPVQPHGP